MSPTKATPSTLPTSSSTHSQDDAIYFWKTVPANPGYMSQWYHLPFTSPEHPGVIFPTAEHYMMYGKALLFAPGNPICAKILESHDARVVKGLGRKIPNFNEKIWSQHREKIVQDGNYYKFTSPVPNSEGWVVKGKTLQELLLETGNKLLVEASPLDKIWGVGLDEANARRADSSKWGLNLLGKALIEVREKIRAEHNQDEQGDEDEGVEKRKEGEGVN